MKPNIKLSVMTSIESFLMLGMALGIVLGLC